MTGSTNRLGRELSPYLLQHKNNPVDWYSWGEEAFAAARAEGKPIFLSIGYSTCYWCHVMERDSFEESAVADILNEHFISIKVDREERPDIDAIYMNAAVVLTGQGGWPLSVFLTPSLKPFFAGTFFPRAQFIEILGRINTLWRERRDDVELTAAELTTALGERAVSAGDARELDDTPLKNAYTELRRNFDAKWGGFGRAPKFPPSGSIGLLLRIHRRTGSTDALHMATTTLERMAMGGLYDHLGGGFHRYSTDERWRVPHFEKMLYDNALLAAVYLEGFQATGNRMFADVAAETLDYVLREMTDETGGFFSAQDAGEVGKEGEFYLWSYDELAKLLDGAQLRALADSFDITPEGNFEHRIVLTLNRSEDWALRKTEPLAQALRALFTARSARPRPHTDDKILTSWNGLMIAAMAKASQVLGEDRYLTAAIKANDFILGTLRQNGALLRRYRAGDARIPGYLDDSAFMVAAQLALHDATLEGAYLRTAIELQTSLDRTFWDDDKGGYYFARPDDPSIITRKKELTDGAEPAGNSIAALNALKLYHLTFDEALAVRADRIFALLQPFFDRYASAVTVALQALDFRLDRTKEIVIAGDRRSPAAVELLRWLNGTFIPNRVTASTESTFLPLVEGKEAPRDALIFYVCENRTCHAPTRDTGEVKRLCETIAPFTLAASIPE